MGCVHHDRKLTNTSVWFSPVFHGPPDPTKTLQWGFTFHKWGNRGSKEVNWPKTTWLVRSRVEIQTFLLFPHFYPSIIFYNSMLRTFIFLFSAHILTGYYIFFPQDFYKFRNHPPHFAHCGMSSTTHSDTSDVKSPWKYKIQMLDAIKISESPSFY